MEKKLSYVGGISYENWHTGSRVEQFEFIENGHIQLQLRSKTDDPNIPDTVLKVVAKNSSDGFYYTGWILLTTPEGEPHTFGESKLDFSISHRDDIMVKIEGAWRDLGAKYDFPFIAILQRKVDSAN